MLNLEQVEETTEEVHGCSDGGDVEDWCDRSGCQG